MGISVGRPFFVLKNFTLGNPAGSNSLSNAVNTTKKSPMLLNIRQDPKCLEAISIKLNLRKSYFYYNKKASMNNSYNFAKSFFFARVKLRRQQVFMCLMQFLMQLLYFFCYRLFRQNVAHNCDCCDDDYFILKTIGEEKTQDEEEWLSSSRDWYKKVHKRK